jgi:hypothetical protein
MLKNWPMPKDVKHENWGLSEVGTRSSESAIDDTRAGIEKMQKANKKISERQTPKKWG